MKSTGITRKVDELGRIVIPKELRRVLKIEEKDPMEIFVENEKIILQKYKAGLACHVTGEVSEKNLVLANGKLIISPEVALQIINEVKINPE